MRIVGREVLRAEAGSLLNLKKRQAGEGVEA